MFARFEEDSDALRASDVGGGPHARTETQTRRADYPSADRRRPRQARKYSSHVRGFAADGLRRSRRDSRRPETHAITLSGTCGVDVITSAPFLQPLRMRKSLARFC